LEFTDEPDFVEQHKPYFCTRCGYDLSQIEGSVIGIRQSVDVPLLIRPIITEHQIIGKKCCCGHCSEANFPENVRSHISYGPNVRALVAYLSCSQ